MKRLSLLLLALLMAGCSNIVIEGQFLAPADVTATALADSTRASPTSTSDLAATAIEGAVRLTLTAAIPSPTDTPPPSPTAEPTTAIPPTDTPVPTATKKPAIQPSAPPPSPTPGEKDPFVGNWFAFDTVDGSSTILTITRSNGSYSLVLVDDRASACGLDEASKPKFAIEIRAAGTARGNVLHATTTSATCFSDPPLPLERMWVIDLTYQTPSDTLIDTWVRVDTGATFSGTVWSRR